MKQWKEWHWYVYIIETNDGFYYTGRTWNISKRYEQHISGKGSKYTARHGVKKLVFVEEHNQYVMAIKREIEIKDMNRNKKLELIKGFEKNSGSFSVALEEKY